MSRIRRNIALSTIAAALVSVAGYAVANPASTGCALISALPLDELPGGVLVEGTLTSQDHAAIAKILAAATSRIENTFGSPSAKPVTVFFDHSDAFWPLSFNEYGSASFVGTRACLFIGPKGRNVDVVAHELIHAELFERVGAWGRFTEVPVWFDEGLAMQVDYRSKYHLAGGAMHATKAVSSLDSARDFFVSDTDRLIWHYSAAKAEVAQWLSTVGNDSVYDRLERIRAGESFSEFMQSE